VVREGHDKDAVRPPPSDKLTDDQSCLYGFAKSHTIGDQQPRPRHLQRTHQWHKLIRLDP
jgi:hypothetical protein